MESEMKLALELKNLNKSREKVEFFISNLNGRGVFDYLLYEEFESAYFYYKLCFVIRSTLSKNDLIDMDGIELDLIDKEESVRIKFSHIKSIIFCDFSFLEKEIESVFLNELVSFSYKNDLLNTYKREVFDFRRKIKPSHLSCFSENYFNDINRCQLNRNSFRESLEKNLIDRFKREDLSFNVSEKSKNIYVFLEDFYINPKSTVNKLILDWLYLIMKYYPDYEINILCLLDFFYSGNVIPGQKRNLEIDIDEMLKTLGLENNGNLTLHYRPGDIDVFSWIKAVLSESDVLSVISFPSPRWPILKVIKSSLPIVAVELANGIDLKDMSWVTLPNGRVTDSVRMKYGRNLFEVEFPQIPFEKEVEYTRKEFSIPKDSIVLVSVGRHLFSRSFLDVNAYFKKVFEILENNKSVIWYFIGEREPEINDSDLLRHYQASNRIIIKENESDLMAFYSLCDVFVMPSIKGGGRGSALAASSGLPCVSFSLSDGAKSLPPQLVFDIESINQYFEKINSLIICDNERLEFSKVCGNIFNGSLLNKSANKMLEACYLANSYFKEN